MKSQRRTRLQWTALVAVVALALAGVPPVSAGQAPAETSLIHSALGTSPTTAGSTFDPSQPFEIVADGDSTSSHVDTVDGDELAPADVDAVFARAGDELQGRALAQATNTFHWRNAANPDDPSRPDILIEADSNVPQAVIDLMGEVMLEWRSAIDLDIPAPEWHHVRISWSSSLENGVLGGALTGWVTVSQNGSTFVIPRFLANVNGAATSSNAVALDMVLNANINWDFTLDPTDAQPNNSYYLKTVLLHEVGHSLGVASGADYLASINSTVLSTWGATFFGNRSQSNPFTSLRSSLVQTNNLWSMNADGTWEKIYDPFRWSQGSSLSHLDENTYTYRRAEIRTPGALMTPILTNGEVNNVDGVIAGLLSQAGYETFLSPAAPDVSASSSAGVLKVAISPRSGTSMNVPAKQWLVTVKSPQGAVVRTATVPATQRKVEFGGFSTSGTYQVSVTAEIDGQRANAPAVGVGFTAVPRTTIAAASNLFGVIYATDYVGDDADTLRLYRAFFERDPDLSGIQYWIGQSRQGVSYDDMAWAFANSNEFTSRYQNLTDQQFLQVVYQNVLGRSPDQAGFDYWYAEVRGGLARHLAVRWIAGSAEFSNRHPYLPQ